MMVLVVDGIPSFGLLRLIRDKVAVLVLVRP